MNDFNAIPTGDRFKIYLSDDDGKNGRTFTEYHPKTSATDEDFGAAQTVLEDVYGLNLDGITKPTEPVIYPTN